MRSYACLRIIFSLTLARTLFIRLSWTFGLAISDRSAVASRDRGSIPRESSSSEARPDVLVGSDALKIKIVEIASGLSFFRQDIPIVGSIALAGWKESSRTRLSHKKLCLDGPFQRRECVQFSLLAESTAPCGGHRSGIKRS